MNVPSGDRLGGGCEKPCGQASSGAFPPKSWSVLQPLDERSAHRAPSPSTHVQSSWPSPSQSRLLATAVVSVHHQSGRGQSPIGDGKSGGGELGKAGLGARLPYTSNSWMASMPPERESQGVREHATSGHKDESAHVCANAGAAYANKSLEGWKTASISQVWKRRNLRARASFDHRIAGGAEGNISFEPPTHMRITRDTRILHVFCAPIYAAATYCHNACARASMPSDAGRKQKHRPRDYRTHIRTHVSTSHPNI